MWSRVTRGIYGKEVSPIYILQFWASWFYFYCERILHSKGFTLEVKCQLTGKYEGKKNYLTGSKAPTLLIITYHGVISWWL